ncbi:PucR family transcriptional regulator [Streptomyces sp. NBC_01497]|uniref:PucR family transcriptional regulator n=1 Tax=Streptomyces sp. NBC_01497 TaxID=2903885 RepID=UPI002E31F10D|nr:PucR family transcriptional regulator [Streptomyces sp. NBC_01497]
MRTTAPQDPEPSDVLPSLALRELTGDPALGLVPMTRDALLDRRIGWAHVSELPDPAPYLIGGELLLTAGIGLPEVSGPGEGARARAYGTYVEGLVRAGVAALGFGLAPVHRTVPPELAAACEEQGLPLLAVPEATAFHAIARTVAAALHRRHADQLLGMAEAQAAIAGAALHRTTPVSAVLEATARAAGGWAVLLDAEGRPLAATAGAPEPGADLRRLAVRLGRADGPRSAVDHGAHGHVALHPVEGTGRAAPGSSGSAGAGTASGSGVRILLLGGDRPPTAAGRGAGTMAAGLLGLLARTARAGTQQGALAALLLLGEDPAEPGRARDLLTSLLGGGPVKDGEPSGGPPLVRALRARRPPGAGTGTGGAPAGPYVPGPLTDDIDDRAGEAAGGGTLRGVLPAGAGRADLERLRERGGWLAALSRPVPPGLLPAADREAHLLLRQAGARGIPVVAEDRGLGIGAAVDPDRAGDWARRTLAPLLDERAEPDGSALVEVLRTWLGCHGGWDRTAQLTGLHRNSVRHRIRRVELLLGVDLSDAAVRAELLLALGWFSGAPRRDHFPFPAAHFTGEAARGGTEHE